MSAESEELRKIRNAIGQIEVSTHDGYHARQQALIILFNAEWRAQDREYAALLEAKQSTGQ